MSPSPSGGMGRAASPGRDNVICGARGGAEKTRTPRGTSREAFSALNVSWGNI
jgi:hypothetical protein